MIYLFALGVLANFAVIGYLVGRYHRLTVGGAQPDLIVGVAATLVVAAAYFLNQSWAAIPLVFATAGLGSFVFVHLVGIGNDQFVAKNTHVVITPTPVDEEKPVEETSPVEPAAVEEKPADVVPLPKKAAKKRRAKKEQ